MTSAHPPVTGAAPLEDEAAPAKELAASPDDEAVSSEESTLHKSSSGAVLASQLPYPDKFHAASKLAGAPEHDGLGFEAAERLLLYALFRQATDGTCTGPRPSLLDPIESAKYMSWGRLEGMSPIEAMFLYVRSLEEQKPDIWDGLASMAETPTAAQEPDSGLAPEAAEEGQDGAEAEAEAAAQGEEEQQQEGEAADSSSGTAAAPADQDQAAKDSDTALEGGVSKQEATAGVLGRLPGVPREAGALDAVLADARRLGKLPDKEAARNHMGAFPPVLKATVRRMLFVDELLSNQAELERKKREAAALKQLLGGGGGVDVSVVTKVTSLVECGKMVLGVIERELADWTAAIHEEADAGPEDMICDRGAFAFKHVPSLARLRDSWSSELEQWESLKGTLPEQGSSASIYSLLFPGSAV